MKRLFLFGFLFGGLIFASPAASQEDVTCTTDRETTSRYWCSSLNETCGSEVWREDNWIDRITCSDGTGGSDGGTSNPYLFKKCSAYEICSGEETPSCACKGKCFPEPVLTPLIEVEKNDLDSEGKPKLPLRLEWKNDVSPCEPDSYQYEINYENEVIKEGSVPEPFLELKECFLKPDKTYSWRVRACFEEECGKWSNYETVVTSPAPELLNPYDPDWKKKEGAEGIPYETKLSWCKNTYEENSEEKEYSSFKVLIYEVKEGNEECHHELKERNECSPKILLPDPGTPYALPELSNDRYAYFTKNTTYAWQVSACKDSGQYDCTNYSQKWRFALENFDLAKTAPSSPSNDPQGEKPVGLPLTLGWSHPFGANSYVYEVSSAGQGTRTPSSVTLDYPQLKLNTLYQWRVKSCWDYEGQNCENEWSDFSYFKTTGEPPIINHPEGENISIPVNFKWEEVSGTKSYKIKIQGKDLNMEEVAEKPEFSLDFPQLRQESDYSWQVKSCAREKGELCGSYNQPQSFRTFKLPPPSELSPQNNSQLSTFEKNYILSWKPMEGNKFYQHEVIFSRSSEKETDENCKKEAGKKILGEITKSSTIPLSISCLGDYQWRARACFDESCNEAGEWSNYSFFSLSEEKASENTGGLVPCGRAANNPSTPWNERESCQFKHLFLLLRNILDFVLWKAIPLFLVILVIYSGIIVYLSMGNLSKSLVKVKTVWKYLGIGIVIIFSAWTISNIVLNIFGFQVSVFGHWYEIDI